jgi:hypothetical protein
MFDPKRYPENWREISHYIRFVRAGGKCEHPDCGVKHGAVGARDADGKWYDEAEIEAMPSTQRYSLWYGGNPKLTKIVLTTAHLGVDYPDGRKGDKHDKLDCRPENLASYCQKCHLAYDMDEHIANRKVTLAKKRAEKIAAIGQQSFLGDS